MRAVGLIIGLSFSLIMAGIYMVNFKWGWEITKWSSTMGANVDDSGILTHEPMPENPLMGFLEKMAPKPKAFEETGQPEVKMQKISVIKTISFSELLGPGEERPDVALEPLYVAARAPQLMSKFCEDVVLTLGTKCRVLESWSSGPKKNIFSVKADLTYLPVNPPNNSVEGSILDAINIRTNLAPLNKDQIVHDTPAERQKYLAKAERICAEVRKTYGSCTLRDVSLSIGSERDSRQTTGFAGRPTLRVKMQVRIDGQQRDARQELQEFIDRLAQVQG